AGENQLDNFSGFPTDYAGGPLIGSGPLVLFIEKGRKNRRFVRKGGKIPAFPGGAARARSALKERRRRPWAAAAALSFGRQGARWAPCRQTPPPPRRDPGGLPLPRGSAAPAALRRLPGGEERTGRSPGAAAFGRPG